MSFFGQSSNQQSSGGFGGFGSNNTPGTGQFLNRHFAKPVTSFDFLIFCLRGLAILIDFLRFRTVKQYWVRRKLRQYRRRPLRSRQQQHFYQYGIWRYVQHSATGLLQMSTQSPVYPRSCQTSLNQSVTSPTSTFKASLKRDRNGESMANIKF